jgi:hypothetical protein
MPIPNPTRIQPFTRRDERPIHLTDADVERFFFYVSSKAGCWEWIGPRFEDRPGLGAYGCFTAEYFSYKAHRVMWSLLHGQIPSGLTVDHLCRNRSCVNPGHLEVVTLRENILRGESPTALNARKTHCSKGHAFTPENTLKRGHGYRSCRACRAANRQAWRAARAAAR